MPRLAGSLGCQTRRITRCRMSRRWPRQLAHAGGSAPQKPSKGRGIRDRPRPRILLGSGPAGVRTSGTFALSRGWRIGAMPHICGRSACLDGLRGHARDMATGFTFGLRRRASANVADSQIELPASHLRTALAIVDHLLADPDAGSFVAGSYQLGGAVDLPGWGVGGRVWPT